ncbi:MAG: M20/M25/M40 family metallo-hydrolase [Pseudomonadota bacterium]
MKLLLSIAVLLLTLAAARPAFAYDLTTLREIVDGYPNDHGAEMLEDFRAFLSLPNVSTRQEDMLANAEWIQRYIGQRGFQSQVVTAGRSPYVLASRHVSDDLPTVLIYAHFDGQPVLPSNWATPPFKPTLKSGVEVLDWTEALAGPLSREWRIYARSAGDDKAPVIAIMHAIDLLEANDLPLSINIKLFLDGEEEFGSPTLRGILEAHGDELDADLMLFCDGPMHQSRRRQLVFGVRGDTAVNLTTYGAIRPLHSGHYGNWAPHPTDSLIRLLSTLKDDAGNILVPGYLDEMTPITQAEREAVAAMPRVEDRLQDELALGRLEGEGRRLEELVMMPAIIIKGFQAGGVGNQARNIILSSATAALDLRLAPGQTVAGVRRALSAHFESQGYHLIDSDPTPRQRRQHPKLLKADFGEKGYRAFRTRLDSPEAEKLIEIVEAFDQQRPLLTPTMGGSLPIYLFEDLLDMPIIILPVANHDNNQHGRDENLRLANLFDAVGVYAAVLSAYGAAPE